jgi:hypothetical protein
MKKVAIVQSNYIPWKGYFDMIAAVDEFILYDNVQYTRRDWRNRNQIKTPDGLQWLTVPVKVKGRFEQQIRETEIEGDSWIESHWKTLTCNYRRAPHFAEIAGWLEPIYRQETFTHLSVLNRSLIEAICGYLGIATTISNAWDYELVEGKTERLISLCLQTGSQEYISGTSASLYINEQSFADRNIRLTWFNYQGFPDYPQLWGKMVHEVSILDLLFNCGRQSPRYLRNIQS